MSATVYHAGTGIANYFANLCKRNFYVDLEGSTRQQISDSRLTPAERARLRGRPAKELETKLPVAEVRAMYDRADSLLSESQNAGRLARLRACARPTVEARKATQAAQLPGTQRPQLCSMLQGGHKNLLSAKKSSALRKRSIIKKLED